jgi:hypothetical protein
MNNLNRLILISLFLSSIVWAREFNLEIEDSLRSIHPRMRAGWLKSRGIEDSRYSKPFFPDSQNVRLVGKWGRGPSFEVTGKDSLVYVSLGSEVAVVKVSNTGVPQILNEIQARSFVYNSILKDSLLFIGAQGEVEIWNVANPLNPIARNNISIVLNDIFVKDTFLYTISEDSFKIFNVANITNPYLIGACRDSGNMVFISGNYAYVGDRWGLYVLNVTNPQNPSRVSVLSGGAEVGGVWVEGNHCYYTTGSGLKIANVRDPANPWEEGSLPSIGGSDIYKLNYFLYLPGFDIIDVSDSSNPTRISHLDLPGWEEGVWANNPFGYAFVADHFEGLQVIDIHDPVNPVRDTGILKAESAEDIVIDNQKAYVADYTMMKIIDVSNPTYPYELGSYDTIGRANIYLTTVAAKDSFAYVPWPFDTSWLRSIDVSDPTNPRFAEIIMCPGVSKDMVIVDSLLYVAANLRFFIFNISNPRLPRLVGRCNLPNAAGCVFLKDTLAYVGSLPSQIINIKDPANPIIIGSINDGPYGISVKDTFAFLAINYGGLQIWSVANPSSTYLINTIYYPRGYDVVINDSFAYFGGLDFRVLNISNPSQAFEIGRYTTPELVRRIFCANGLIYAVCAHAGMVILEQLPPGIAEEHAELNKKEVLVITPNPTTGKFSFKTSVKDGLILIYDLTGKLVKKITLVKPRSGGDISDLSDGVYFIALRSSNNKILTKLIKTRGR